MGSHINCLSDRRSESECVSGAFCSTPGVRAWSCRGVIKLHEIGSVPVGSLIVDIGLFNLSVVVLELHEDLAILFVVGEAGFLLELVSPKGRIVTPATSESVNTVRVSHFDESDAIAKLNDTKSCEGMTEVQTITVSV